MPPEFHMGLWRGFFWLAFFPQLVFWVLFTLVLGTLSGSLTALVASARIKSPPAYVPR
ncbi:MAG: hypothetical protein ACRD1Z_02215 [Vicinamibacteria bacterium]